MNRNYALSEDQIEVLQEFMNRAHGSATAIIAEIFDAFATLNVPKIDVLRISEFEKYIKGILFLLARG